MNVPGKPAANKVAMVTMPCDLKMISASVDICFSQSTEAFVKNPGSDQYVRLTKSALALQYWRGLMPTKREEVGMLLWDKPIGTWTETLVLRQRHDFNAAVED